MVRAEAQECQAELVVERWTLAADCKDFMNAWTEVGATQMALGAERAKIETARYDAAAARDMEQDSGSRAAFEAPGRGPATMPLGRRQRLRKAASTMFRGSKDKL
ncbi:hypothetical protein H4R21_004708 [Coemansia helicoidea]|uniref:Uncharacterized protein n=1 Tax=Coemansia helicoidea TaxID=1286919 RepID=A0ACC1KWN5_9FUNG|nr:hypothetical protein H4R21_004708 [Coemansia helicoidea]